MRELTELAVELAKQSRVIEQLLSEQTQLPISQIRLLLKMDQHPINLQVLTNDLALDASTLSRQLASLIVKGEVGVVTLSDKRQREYHLTETGMTCHRQLWQQLDALQTAWLGDWCDEDIHSLAKLLKRALSQVQSPKVK
ncbi:hypothetical protein ACFQ4L_09265 [Lapidilactobacillus mulanensis]|uniref:MarR family transcriptional regulator n=1 Tax=Lapidilactobacillus mulanensis TaxID=2485999 RepID=A0ABW4DQY7_9LACO|nr:MarR family winged helix-turn-helix transcriptional regulator [Lapidilactobacillus mulanensis]